jgi:transcriptional regulator with XRE-family HTH domain
METFYSQVVGQVVRGARELRHIDLAGMATAIQLSPSAWSRVETGGSVMSISQLRRAASTLRVQPWELVRQADDLAITLGRQGIPVRDDKPVDVGNVLLGGAAILAVVAGAAALAAAAQQPPPPRRPHRK